MLKSKERFVFFSILPWGVIKYSLYKGEFILAYYKAERIFQADVSNHIEKVEIIAYEDLGTEAIRKLLSISPN